MKKKAEMSKPPSDDELATRWLELHPGTVFAFDCFRRSIDGSWVLVSTDQVEKEIYGVLKKAENEGIQVSIDLIDSVVRICKLICLFLPCDNENHSIRDFLDARCEKGIAYLMLFEDIWRDYCEWAPANGYKCRPEDDLRIDLKLRGFTTRSFDRHIYWAGLRLKLG
jgi:hypothetical protein